MSLDSAVAQGRAAAEARMTDTCLITGAGSGDRGALNPTTGKYDSTPARVTIYEGPCQFDIGGGGLLGNASQAVAGDSSWDVADSLLKLPAQDTDAVRVDHTVECLTSDDDPSLEGRSFGVIAVATANQKTARRCRIREVVAD